LHGRLVSLFLASSAGHFCDVLPEHALGIVLVFQHVCAPYKISLFSSQSRLVLGSMLAFCRGAQIGPPGISGKNWPHAELKPFRLTSQEFKTLPGMFAPTPHRALGGGALFDANSSAASLGGLTLSPPVRSAGGTLDGGGGADLLVSPPAAAASQTLDSPAIAAAPALAAPAEPIAWRKILWEAQPFEDNHTPDSFLSSAVLNANVQTHTFASMYALRVKSRNFVVYAIIHPLRNENATSIVFPSLQDGRDHAHHAANFVLGRLLLCLSPAGARPPVAVDAHARQRVGLPRRLPRHAPHSLARTARAL
jgi:hypothetical protein